MSAPSDPFPPEDPTLAMTPPSSGGSILPAGPLALREVIGDFEVLGRLGQGGMGAVYRARQVSLDRMVALKVLPGQFIEDAASVARFQREARVAASLSHANLVRVYSSGEAAGCHFIAMELIEGEDLGRRLKNDGALPATEALRIGLAVAEGLQHGWQNAQLIHRDIKPANIFLADDGTVKLGDLGLAKSLLGNSTGLTQSGTMMGTPHYISPEQARGDRELDFRADIYSLGCTLFQMLTGQVPYGGQDAITIIRQHLDAPLPAILKVWPQCPIPLARLVGKMLKKSRHERPASYAELIGQMKSVWAQIDPVGFEPESFAPPVRREVSPAEERPPSTPLPPPPARSRLPLYGGLAAGVAVLAVVAWLVWPKPEKLTQAQLIMAKRDAAKIAAPATPAPPAALVAATKEPAAPASTAPAPVAIKLWDAPEKLPKGDGIRWQDNALRLSNVLAYHGHLSRDGIIRASIRMNPDASQPQIALRQAWKSQTSEERRYMLTILVKEGDIDLQEMIGSRLTNLKGWRLPRHYGADEWARLELRAVGDALTASLDGQVLGTVHDTSITEPGGVFLYAAANGYFRDIEYVPLDGAAASSSARLSASTEPWQDLLAASAKLELWGAGKAQFTPDGLVMALNAWASTMEKPCDGAIRLVQTYHPGQPSQSLFARMGSGSAPFHQIHLTSAAEVVVQHVVARQITTLRVFRLTAPLPADGDYELEVRMIGSELTVKLNGATLGNVPMTDDPKQRGSFGVANPAGTAAITAKALQFLPLPSPASAVPK